MPNPCEKPLAARKALAQVVFAPTEKRASLVDEHTHSSRKIAEELPEHLAVAEDCEETVRTI